MPRCPRHHVERRGATGPTTDWTYRVGNAWPMDTAGIGDTGVTRGHHGHKGHHGKTGPTGPTGFWVRCYRSSGPTGPMVSEWGTGPSGPPVQSPPGRDAYGGTGPTGPTGQQETAMRALSGQLDPWVSQEIPYIQEPPEHR